MNRPSKPPRILVIAGSDSSGGAGIQADIKTITMLSGYAMTAITAITAQNTVGVQAVETLDTALIAAQIDSCVSDIGVDAVKIGMLGSAEIAQMVADKLEVLEVPIVFDPVMVATSGAALADDDTIAAFERLMHLASVVTPNVQELERLTGASDLDGKALVDAAQILSLRYKVEVLAKGGHDPNNRDLVTDWLMSPDGTTASFSHERLDTIHTHGTGCTLASAIACLLGHGQSLENAVRVARQFVLRAIQSAPGFGAGGGPLGHHGIRNVS